MSNHKKYIKQAKNEKLKEKEKKIVLSLLHRRTTDEITIIIIDIGYEFVSVEMLCIHSIEHEHTKQSTETEVSSYGG